MTDQGTCGVEKDNGERCQVDFSLCSCHGQCFHHAPCREEERHAARSRGGETTRKRYQGKGLKDEELPPLDSPEHAERWLEIVGRAVGTGRLPHNDAKAMIRAVQEFLRSQRHDLEGEVSDLRDQVEELRAKMQRADLKAMD